MSQMVSTMPNGQPFQGQIRIVHLAVNILRRAMQLLRVFWKVRFRLKDLMGFSWNNAAD
jgi:hypothetical protein